MSQSTEKMEIFDFIKFSNHSQLYKLEKWMIGQDLPVLKIYRNTLDYEIERIYVHLIMYIIVTIA